MDINTRASQYLIDVYKRIPLNITHGDGVWLYNDDGSAYLDFLAGIAVNALGYNHPLIKETIIKQVEKNLHLSNLFVQEIHISLAKKLIELTPFSKVFFTNSGTEAIEGLLKLVKKWGNERNKSKIISFQGSFHGRSIGAVSITGQEKYRKGFQPLLPNIEIVPYNDVNAFEMVLDDDVAGVFFEGISGEGGIREISPEMIEAIKSGKEKYDFLVVADEIQTGVGRTGAFYNFEHYDFIPDAIATAKGLGGGLPLGAFLVSEKIKDLFKIGEHGTTYGGNPLACATGLATVNYVSTDTFLKSIIEKGTYFKAKLESLAKKYPSIIKEVRGRGLILGVEVHHSAIEIKDLALKEKLIFNVAGGGTVLRFVPPLIIENKHIDTAVSILDSILKNLTNQ
ncbi:MAG: acetylornithine/succinylornithine family transaminase [Calditrichaeota bacterium]|nr:MAG: aminotransferase class III-fold pyridoxal phosphate-dependent enzyme [Calditrichota bacterium]MBL1204184.1 acetylornithine/succinylornithine family transaminase [Calditrichota bacterium]NOG44014.1 acetylornithine/succinylornithine family transaminase [Calditrichota bacterium]